MVRVQPLTGHILIKPIKEDEDPQGLILPDASKEKTTIATVLAVGQGELLPENIIINGERHFVRYPVEVTIGQKVYYRYSGIPVELEGEACFLVNQRDLVGVIEEIDENDPEPELAF